MTRILFSTSVRLFSLYFGLLTIKTLAPCVFFFLSFVVDDFNLNLEDALGPGKFA